LSGGGPSRRPSPTIRKCRGRESHPPRTGGATKRYALCIAWSQRPAPGRRKPGYHPERRIATGNSTGPNALLSKSIENMHNFKRSAKCSLLPGLSDVAVGTGDACGHRREEHAAALAAVGGAIQRTTRVAHALDGAVRGARRSRPRPYVHRGCPAVQPAGVPPLAQGAGDAFAQGICEVGSHGCTGKDSADARRFRSASSISWPNDLDGPSRDAAGH
jgi:hypothetical protein